MDTIPNLQPGSIAEYEAEVLVEIEAQVPKDPLADLRSNYDASAERLADVTERYNASLSNHKANVQAITDKLDEEWRKSNAELIDEYLTEGNTVNKLKAKIQAVIREEAERQLQNDPKVRAVRKDLGFHFNAPDEVFVADEKQAIEWAGKFLPMSVKTTLDRKMFDGFVLRLPATERPSCVTVRAKITPVIKTGRPAMPSIKRDPHVLIILSIEEQAAICGRCALPDCDLRSARCGVRAANAAAKQNVVVGYRRRAALARQAGQGYWPEIHGKV